MANSNCIHCEEPECVCDVIYPSCCYCKKPVREVDSEGTFDEGTVGVRRAIQDQRLCQWYYHPGCRPMVQMDLV